MNSRIAVDEEFSSCKIYKDVNGFEEYVHILQEYLKYSLLDFRQYWFLKNCQLIVDTNYQYQGKGASALSAEKDR